MEITVIQTGSQFIYVDAQGRDMEITQEQFMKMSQSEQQSVTIIGGVTSIINSDAAFFYNDERGRRVEIDEKEFNMLSKSDQQRYENMIVTSPKSQAFMQAN